MDVAVVLVVFVVLLGISMHRYWVLLYKEFVGQDVMQVLFYATGFILAVIPSYTSICDNKQLPQLFNI